MKKAAPYQDAALHGLQCGGADLLQAAHDARNNCDQWFKSINKVPPGNWIFLPVELGIRMAERSIAQLAKVARVLRMPPSPFFFKTERARGANDDALEGLMATAEIQERKAVK